MNDDLTFGPDDPPWEPCDCVDRIPALEAEVERMWRWNTCLRAEVERLREENDTYRKALDEIRYRGDLSASYIACDALTPKEDPK